MSKKTLAIDFDGVLSAYTGWKGEAHLDPPLPGAIPALRGYLEHYNVVVFTTRAQTPEGRVALRGWFSDAGLSRQEIAGLDITMLKPPAWLYIDDRCLCFDGKNWPNAEAIEAFKPWWQK